ncbi:Myb-like DNA-binding domain containing protein [Tritrichomonas foetus]|uniref:Myb-like DNA-binding domain containing protein n=1 Tax=Tritrichomonas foetus TaxID=1144522 RepID=A0A1J4J5P1_9EUKA|nr:Myb-like DNA-binding domain containing protein [Tritrichomonas foetus]|eukprot:OHS92963.1 Myb-like DNA-binding domain containing protein [Tritrichomonas foetus]
MEATALAPTRNRKQETRISRSTTWTPEEDEMLTQFVSQSQPVSWSVLASYFPNKTAPQLAGRWEKVINPQLIKGSWTREEDETIINYVREHGDKDWAKLALALKGRTGKQCRERFKNHLDTSVKHTAWTPEEDNKLIELHNKFGNSWTKISSYFEGRTDNCIKNRWNSTIKKRLERIQKGEPLVMKRGRKPKNSVPSPVIVPSQSSSNMSSINSSALPTPPSMAGINEEGNFGQPSGCSSPVAAPRSRMTFPLIELVPLNSTSFTPFRPVRLESEKIKMPSLQQNRIDLQRMLNDLTA